MEYGSKLQAVQRQMFADILTNDKYSDATFIIGENQTQFNVNRVFLAAISPVFHAMLYGEMQESKPNSEVAIKDIDHVAFQCILNFAYNNDPKITPQNVLSVIHICDKYQISLLRPLCDQYFSTCLNTTNLCALLNDAVQLKSDDTIQKCMACLQKNCNESMTIIKSDAFLQLSLNAMKLFLQSDHLQITEDELWKYVIKWVEYQCKHNPRKQHAQVDMCDQEDSKNENDNNADNPKESRKHLLKSIAPCMRFGLMNGEYFAKHIVTEGILTQSELVSVLLYFQNQEAKCGSFSTNFRGIKPKIKGAGGLKPLSYTLAMSGKHGSPPNTAEALNNTNLDQGCGTANAANSWIEVSFGHEVNIAFIEVAGPGSNMPAGWNVSYLNTKTLQYKNMDGNWVDVLVFEKLQQNVLHPFKVNVICSAMRVHSKNTTYVAMGCWRLYT
eukprot:1064478_1